MSDEVADLRIQMTKRSDGTVVLRCIRRDGSATWQRYENHSSFYAFHDLRHLAVETVLGFQTGFYGLIASGWDISDTGGKGSRSKLPASSILVEHIVGLLDGERSGGAPPLSAAQFNALIDEMIGIDPNRSRLSDSQLTAVRDRIEELHQQWAGVPPGSSLDLTFSASVQTASSRALVP